MNCSVLITGASSGFGRAFVKAFLEKDWTVYAGMRRAPERGSEFAAELERFGTDRLRIIELDLTSASDHKTVTRKISEAVGSNGLQLLINNAGFGLFGPFEGISERDLRQQFEVNFFGTVLLTQALLPLLRAARGRIINIGSVAGRVGMPLGAAYGSSKFALAGWSEALRFELKPHGVDVALVEPGAFQTGFASHVIFSQPEGKLREVYGLACDRYRALMKGRPHGAPDLNPVVQTVLRVAEHGSCRPRIVCGLDARILSLLRKVLPDSWYDALMTWNYRRKLGAPDSH